MESLATATKRVPKPLVSEDETLSSQWDHTKNAALGFFPDQITQGSGIKVWWLCPNKSTPECDNECVHSWPAEICNRTRLTKPTGCPFCSDNGGSQRCCRHRCVAATHPHLVNEFVSIVDNINLMGEKITLYNVSAGSTVRVLWKCLNPKLTEFCDPVDCQHTWETTINNRTNKDSGCCWAGCCSVPKKFCIHYSLACKRPDIAAQWHPTLNQNSSESTPDKVLPNSAKEKYWLCQIDQNHSWTVSVNSRVSYNTGCPHCKNKTEAKLEAHLLPSFPDLLTQIKIRIDGSNHTYDFFIPSLRVYIELDGVQHFKQVKNWTPPEETRIRDVIKMNCAWSQGFSMIRISQIDVFGDQFNWREKLAYWLEYFKSNNTLDVVFITSDFDLYEPHIQDLAKSVGDKWMIIRRGNVVSVIPKIHISEILTKFK